MEELIHQAAEILAAKKNVVALTGAGISVESGIPPFRGKGGLWEKIDPMKYAHIDAFIKDPAEVWDVLIKSMKEVLDRARPNAAHKALFRLERAGILKTIITQNVDGLHQAAGSKDVIEFHGSFAVQRCMDCHATFETGSLKLDSLPPMCQCGGILRPDVVFFGELIPPNHLKRSQLLAAGCDAMLVIGTSATVEPAAYMPVIAKRSGAVVIEVNPEPTPLTRLADMALMGKAGKVMSLLAEEVEKLIRQW